MTTIIFTFLLALLTSLLLTPAAAGIGRRFRLVDLPSERKVHTRAVPRIGGVALFLAFFLPLLLLAFNRRMFTQFVSTDYRLVGFVTGAVLIFGLGLWDDIRRLPSWFKFAGQILVGAIMFYGGIRINVVSLPFVEALSLGWFSLPATIFWFVLVINAINLIDGLDGLAAGISLFVSLTMLVICLINDRILESLGFAALGGSLLGFLRYNFNPASIFMGDCGSYFLGYMLAALSILGSIKGQFATAMLIPVLALGIPLIDTMFAPIRRFLLGQKMFQPDSGHLHHRLLRLGYTQRRAVLMIYALTVALGFLAIFLVYARDETAALILLVVGSGGIFTGRVFGLQPFLTPRKIGGWLREVSDVSGLTHDRRSFLNHQLAITGARTTDELWDVLCRTLDALSIDFAELVLYTKPISTGNDVCPEGMIEAAAGGPFRRLRSVAYAWSRDGTAYNPRLSDKGLLKIEQPLMTRQDDQVCHYGVLVLVKDLRDCSSGHYYMLTRIEHLRRTLNSALERISLDR